MSTLLESFDFEKLALAAACERVARDVLSAQLPDRDRMADHFTRVAAILRADVDWDAQAEAAASLRSFLRRALRSEWPGPEDSTTWESDLDEAWRRSYIFAESRYREVREQRRRDEGCAQGP